MDIMTYLEDTDIRQEWLFLPSVTVLMLSNSLVLTEQKLVR